MHKWPVKWNSDIHPIRTVQRKKINEDNGRALWDDIKHTNTCITGYLHSSQQEEKIEKDRKYIWSNYNLRFPLCEKWNRYPGPGSTENPKLDEPKKTHTRTSHIKVMYKGTLIKLSANISAEILQARMEWRDVFQVLKGKNLYPTILYLARLFIVQNWRRDEFPTWAKAKKKLISTKLAFQEVSKGLSIF